MRLKDPAGIALTCEFQHGDEFHKGPIAEFYPDGLFVETDAAVERASVLEILLVNPATGESVTAEAIVERRIAPSDLVPRQDHGLQLRLFHITPEYSLLIGATTRKRAAGAEPLSERALRRTADSDWANTVAISNSAAARGARAPRAPIAPTAEPREPEAPLQVRAGEPVFDENSPAPRVVVIDDGELTDVVAMLHEIDASPCRLTPTASGELRDWVPPTQLLVISARRALTIGHGLDLARAEFTAVVVSDSDARTLNPIVHRLGYRYVIRRPVHPEAVRTLLRQSLHLDGGRRAKSRTAIGCLARWKLAGTLKRREGTIVDLSRDGCRLLVTDVVPMAGRIHIRIVTTFPGCRSVNVRGRVMRKSTLAGGQRELGVVFEEPSAQTLDRLARIIAALASGPTRLSEAAARKLGETEYDVETADLSASEPDVEPAAPDADAAPSVPQRRRSKRAAFQRELVALDERSESVRLSLIGRDLSVDGMRVEPNPELGIDDQLRLAFYDRDDREPLILHAVVTRNDGRRGHGLRFIGMDADERARLAEAIESLPGIESLDDPGPEAAWAAIGQLELVQKKPD